MQHIAPSVAVSMSYCLVQEFRYFVADCVLLGRSFVLELSVKRWMDFWQMARAALYWELSAICGNNFMYGEFKVGGW